MSPDEPPAVKGSPAWPEPLLLALRALRSTVIICAVALLVSGLRFAYMEQLSLKETIELNWLGIIALYWRMPVYVFCLLIVWELGSKWAKDRKQKP